MSGLLVFLRFRVGLRVETMENYITQVIAPLNGVTITTTQFEIKTIIIIITSTASASLSLWSFASSKGLVV